MSIFARRCPALAAFAAAVACGGLALAEDSGKTKPAADKAAESEIARYCAAIEPNAAEARLHYQMKRLAELEARVKEEVAALEKTESETREWVTKRDELMKAASEDVVLIYSKMSADAAATQIAALEDSVAASILSKLKPQTASAILNEMDVDRAAKLTTLLSAGPAQDKKS